MSRFLLYVTVAYVSFWVGFVIAAIMAVTGERNHE